MPLFYTAGSYAARESRPARLVLRTRKAGGATRISLHGVPPPCAIEQQPLPP